jgi:hypothetical protein
MSKHAANTASTTKKFLAAGGLAFGVASLGLFASAGTAAADGQNIPDLEPMGSNWGDPDGAEVRDISMVPAVDSYDTSADVLGANTPVSSYPAPSTWPAPPSWGSYPAAPSHPGSGWGVDDRA